MRRFNRVFAATLLVSLFGAQAMAAPQATREVQIPVPFDTETARIFTSACMSATERTYSTAQWWSTASDAPETAFRNVLTAMLANDREALLRLSDPASVEDRAEFNRQADAYFSQMASLQIEAVPVAYDLGGVIAFYARFRIEGKRPFAPFTFVRERDGTVKFLPVRKNQTALSLLDYWFLEAGPGAGGASTFCTDAQKARATHHIPLGGRATIGIAGVRLNGAANLGDTATKVKSAVEAIQKAAKASDANRIANQMNAAGADQLRKWNGTAEKLDRDHYFASLRTLQPFFVFDATPLAVAYVRTADGVKALYFTRDEKGNFRWTNSAHLTIADEVFKKGAAMAAASEDPPFRALAAR